MFGQLIDRRDFLRRSGLVSALAHGAVACRSDDGPELVPSSSSSSVSSTAFELEELTVSALREGLVEGRFTARSVTEQYLARIESLDRGGPSLRAILEVNPDALAIAETRDRERQAGNASGLLHGVPVLLKDNIDTADRLTTTAGSLALEGSIAATDSEIARRLRKAGAILLGKTNLSEWANFRSTRSSSGWSGRGGQCRNPYVLDRNPCGSSSGSAVAVSANLAALAVGTETDGSIVCPSSANGVVGIKPTVGLVSRRGIIPISRTQDTAGPMARTVRDAALLLSVMAGPDSGDPATRATRDASDYTRFLDAAGLRGARLGVVRTFFGFHDKVDRVMEEALLAMRDAGAVLVDPVGWVSPPGMAARELEVLLYEFKAGLDAYLSALGPAAPVRSLAELIAFNEQHRDREMPFFEQELFIQAEERGPLTDPRYREAVDTNRAQTQSAIDAVLDTNRLDALVAPTGGPAWTTDLVNGDHFSGGSSRPAAVSGYPSMSVPAGDVLGLPVGVSFFGRAWSEPTLLKIAYAFEQEYQARRIPTFLPTVDGASV